MSAASASVAIIVHRTDDFWRQRYLVQLCLPYWEAMNLRVRVVPDDEPFAPADVAILHSDLSVTPELSRALAERYERVVNGRVHDIRKRRYSELLVGSGYTGPVIVKTDLNCGGLREFRQSVLESPAGPLLRRVDPRGYATRVLSRVDARRPWATRRVLPVGSYRVFDTASAVPRGVWRNANLIVERFVAERDGDRYCCRHWLFFGGQEVHRRTISSEPVVKAHATLEQLDEPVPERLRELRAAWGFDFGKFDYGLVDGEVVLYDMNRTPGATADARRHTRTVEVLSKGIAEFLDR